MPKKPKKRGRGRPALPKDDVKQVFAIRLSARELASLHNIAAELDLSIRELAVMGLRAIIDRNQSGQSVIEYLRPTPVLEPTKPPVRTISRGYI